MSLSPRTVRSLYVWHKWTGLGTGIFILFLSVTGAIAVFRPEIDRWATAGRGVTPAGPRASVDRAVSAAHGAFPGARLTMIEWPRSPRDAYVFRAADATGAFRIFVDPYSARVTGHQRGEHLANVLRQAHVRFYFFGWQGRVVVGLFGVLLAVSSVTGLIIYWPFMRGLFARGLRFWHVRPGLQWASSDTHKLVGVVAVVFNLVIGVSGAVLGLENLSRYSPAVSRALHPNGEGALPRHWPEGASAVPVSSALAVAESAFGTFVPKYIQMPAPTRPYYEVSGNPPARPTAAGASWVIVDAVTGRPLQYHDARAARPVTRLYTWMEPLHFGDFAGVWLKAAYCLFGATSGFLAITGFVLWFTKRRHRRPAAAGRAVTAASWPAHIRAASSSARSTSADTPIRPR